MTPKQFVNYINGKITENKKYMKIKKMSMKKRKKKFLKIQK